MKNSHVIFIKVTFFKNEYVPWCSWRIEFIKKQWNFEMFCGFGVRILYTACEKVMRQVSQSYIWLNELSRLVNFSIGVIIIEYILIINNVFY